MGAMILQMVGCLLVAATIGLMMGWLLRSFATSEKRQQLSEIATRLRGREHELDTLNHELKVRTSAVQMLEGKMITSEAALKDLTADLGTKVEQLTALQTEVREKGVRLHAAERERDTLRREVEEAEARIKAQSTGFAEMQAQMENAEDVLIALELDLANLRTQSQEDLARFGETLQERDAEIQRLRTTVEELDMFRGEVEKKDLALREAEERRVMDVSEREEEIGALRKRLVEYRVAQRFSAQAKSTGATESGSTGSATTKRSAGKGHPAQKDDLKQIHGIGPVMERVLNRMGMFTFRQIAEWKEQDVEHMASELNTFPDRIRHDNWIDGAKEQHFLKYGEEL
ncbi:MAG: hypothetical protein IPM88_19500 [Nitrospira sp.]|nr:hypothetical protein [Nitrospira sp.]